MAEKTKRLAQVSWLQPSVVRISRVHFLFVFAYALSTIIYDSWNLITPSVLRQRWTLVAFTLALTAMLWYVARTQATSTTLLKTITFLFITMDIALAAFSVYSQRGMASRSVALFAIPIAVSAILLNRTAIFATAALCTAAYGLAALWYFIDFPSEGYKVELYGDISFYSASFFILAAILWTIAKTKHSSSS